MHEVIVYLHESITRTLPFGSALSSLAAHTSEDVLLSACQMPALAGRLTVERPSHQPVNRQRKRVLTSFP